MLPGILPDSKSQVTLIYNEDNKPIGCDNIVVSTQHTSDLTKKKYLIIYTQLLKDLCLQNGFQQKKKYLLTLLEI